MGGTLPKDVPVTVVSKTAPSMPTIPIPLVTASVNGTVATSSGTSNYQSMDHNQLVAQLEVRDRNVLMLERAVETLQSHLGEARARESALREHVSLLEAKIVSGM